MYRIVIIIILGYSFKLHRCYYMARHIYTIPKKTKYALFTHESKEFYYQHHPFWLANILSAYEQACVCLRPNPIYCNCYRFRDDCGEDAYQSIDEYEDIPDDLCTDFDQKLASDPQPTRKMNVYNQQNSENDATQAILRKGLCSSIDHYSRPRTENEYVSIYKEHYEVPSKDDANQIREATASVARQNQTGFRESMPIDPAPSAPSINSVEYMCLQQNDSTEDNHYTIAEECSEAAKQVADDYV